TFKEKVRFTEYEKEDNIFFNNDALLQLNKKYSSIENKIKEVLEVKRRKSDQQFDLTHKAIDNLKKEVRSFKDDIEKSEANLQDKCTSVLKYKVLIENTTQTNGEDQNSKKKTENSNSEVFNIENQIEILTAIKDCMHKIVRESRSNWEGVIFEISKFLKENYVVTKKQLEVSIIEYFKNNSSLQTPACDPLIIETENIEKELLDVYLILERQVVEVKAIANTLRYFRRRFAHFAQKCDERWKDSCQAYIIICNTVQESQENMNFSSCRMSRISCSLNQRSTELEDLMKELGVITQIAAIRSSESHETHGAGQLEETCASMEELENNICKIEDIFRSNTGCILELIEKPGKKLESVLHYIEELGILSDFVKNVSKTRENAVSRSTENLYRNGNGAVTRSSLFEESKDNESVSNASLIEGSLYQDVEGTEELLSCGEMSATTLQNEVLQVIPHKRIISLLNSAIRKTVTGTVKNGNISNQKELKKKSIGVPLLAKSEGKESNVWGLTASEMTLSDINSDCLLPVSSPSSSGED
ncbi:uncharacterized protein NPIL_145001, partial [Nephila pilipes]